MSMKIVFLGTAASIPTDARALPSVVVQRKNEVFMFDCGEGVQRQMIRAHVGFHKKMKSKRSVLDWLKEHAAR